MVPDEWSQSAEIIGLHLTHPCRTRQNLLYHQGVDVNQTRLQKVQRQSSNLLVLETISSNLSSLTKENKAVRTIPTLNNIKPLINLPTQGLRMKILTQENSLKSLT